MTNKKSNKGFTLIEILIAMSIISLIAMAFFTFLNTSIRFNSKNEKDIKALNIAQSEVENLREQIKSGKTEDFKFVNGSTINLNSAIPNKLSLEVNGVLYNLEIDLKESENLYTIHVNVKLNNKYISKKSIDLVTQVFGG